MEDESNLPQKEPESYHVMIQKTEELLMENSSPIMLQQIAELLTKNSFPKSNTRIKALFKKVVLLRKNGKETDKVLESIRQSDRKWEEMTPEQLQATFYAIKLSLVNVMARKAGMEQQEVNDNVYLVTTFKKEIHCHIIRFIYHQVDDITAIEFYDPESSEEKCYFRDHLSICHGISKITW